MAWADGGPVIAYVDETGDTGQYKGSATYALGCVMVRMRDWPDVFEALVSYRRWLRDQFGVRLSDEVKANNLIRSRGDLERLQLGDGQRHRIWRGHLRLVEKLDMRAFAVVIKKEEITRWQDPLDTSWRYLLQRLERLSAKEDVPVLVVHDDGDAKSVRQVARKSRRINYSGSIYGTGYTDHPFRRLIEDPVPRNSKESYLLQIADLVAYAAFRTIVLPGRGSAQVCPAGMWHNLGDAMYAAANSAARVGEPGVVIWPK